MLGDRQIKGDDSRFTWDNKETLTFSQCGSCSNKYVDTSGCSVYPSSIPLKFSMPKGSIDCPDRKPID